MFSKFFSQKKNIIFVNRSHAKTYTFVIFLLIESDIGFKIDFCIDNRYRLKKILKGRKNTN